MTETKMLSHAEGFGAFLYLNFSKLRPWKLAAQSFTKPVMKGEVVLLDKLANKLIVQGQAINPTLMVRGVNGLF